VPNTFQSSRSLPLSERRVHPRQRVLFSCADLGEDNGGIVLNISEGGLALETIAELVGEELPKMRFQFSRSPAWIEAKGHITWRSDSRKTAGVEFIDLPPQARKQIQTWISSTSAASGFQEEIVPLVNVEQFMAARASSGSTNRIRVSGKKVPEPVPNNLNDHSIFSLSRPPGGKRNAQTISRNAGAERVTSPGEARYLAGPLFLALMLLTGFVFLGYHLGNWVNGRPIAITAAAAVPDNPSNTSEAPAPSPSLVPTSAPPPIPAPTPAVPPAPKPSSDSPSYVLQVGAMSLKGNADTLVESLRQRNFPAFVIKSEKNHLYLVIIGPYDDANKTAQARAELKRQGFEGIPTDWKPPAQSE
jgi:cell division septation protein DedD